MRTLYKYIQMTWIGVIVNQHYESFMVNPWLVKIKVPWNRAQNGHIQWINTNITRCFRWISGEKKVDITYEFHGDFGGEPNSFCSNSLPWVPHVISSRWAIEVALSTEKIGNSPWLCWWFFAKPSEKWWSESQLGLDDIPNMTGKS